MPKKKTAKKATRKSSLSNAKLQLVPQQIAPRVQIARGEKVLLDSDLAELYGVETKSLNQAVKRNAKRFPEDFMFQLTRQEWSNLKCQISTSSSQSTDSQKSGNLKSQSVTSSYGGRRTPPHAFTEQGVAMLSSVLNSDRAIEVNIAIMRTFVQLRELMATNRMLQDQIEHLEKKYDGQFEVVFDAIKRLMQDRDAD